jgi:TPR repeat protein
MQKLHKTTLTLALAACLADAALVALAQAPEYKFDPADKALWDVLRDSGTPEAFHSYLDLYPDGQFADEARERLQATEAKPTDESRTMETEDSQKSAKASIPKPPPHRRQGFLGVELTTAASGETDQIRQKGALITEVSKLGPAAQAGLRHGDVIVRVNDHVISEPGDLVEISSHMQPGDRIYIDFMRDLRREQVSFPLADRFELLWREAHLGRPSSMYSLYLAFLDGNGPKKDLGAALDWLRRASEAGHSSAHYALARRYQLGNGVAKDLPRALSLFEKAGEAGDGRGMYRAGLMHRLGEGTVENPAMAAAWYRRAIDAGDPRALVGLAVLYRLGNGAPKDYARARSLYGEAIARNQRSAYLPLARMHLRGQGGPRDADRAVGLLSKAVQLGHTGSMVALGKLLIDGEQVEQDRTRGIRLLRQAAADGNRTALRELDDLGVTAYDPLELQQLLAKAGYDPGPLDGKPGRKTRAAILAFQQAAGLKADGDPSLDIVLALRNRLGIETGSY